MNNMMNQTTININEKANLIWSIKELNLISWNGKEAKYDLRDWAPEHEKMGKGVTLSIDELKKLKELLNNMDI